MILGFDHFIVVVRDLDAAMATYTRLGFDVRAGGEHPHLGSHNALVPFADGTYLELVAFKDKERAAQSVWREAVKMLGTGEGFAGYALASDDASGDAKMIRARGLDMQEPAAGERQRPDGQRVAWRMSTVGVTLTGLLPFLIQDETPRGVRVEKAATGLGELLKVREVVVAVRDLSRAKSAYRALLNAEAREVQNLAGDLRGARVSLAWGSIILAQSQVPDNALADHIQSRGEGLYAVTFAASDYYDVREVLRQHNVPIEERGAEGIHILPRETHGARLRIAAR
jgi:catechol 2,3-dioxygenase-like lactoylglutathione lyase family enzyme